MTFDEVRRAALTLPGVEDSTSYGTPALTVRKALLARLWEDGETLVLKVGLDEKELLIELDPAVFFETDHYRGWPAVLVRLPLADPAQVQRLIAQAWREKAGARLVKAYDGVAP